MKEAQFRGPSPAANLVQVDARELERLRRIKDAAWAVLVAYDECEGIAGDIMDAKIHELREAIRDDLH
jgi:hypothetical protein